MVQNTPHQTAGLCYCYLDKGNCDKVWRMVLQLQVLVRLSSELVCVSDVESENNTIRKICYDVEQAKQQHF